MKAVLNFLSTYHAGVFKKIIGGISCVTGIYLGISFIYKYFNRFIESVLEPTSLMVIITVPLFLFVSLLVCMLCVCMIGLGIMLITDAEFE